MTSQAISASALICMGRSRRAALMRAARPETPARHGTGFLNGIQKMHAAETGRTLAGGELQRLPQRDLTVRCISGELWLTRNGDGEDHILGPGRSFAIRRADLAAVQALKASRVRLIPD